MSFKMDNVAGREILRRVAAAQIVRDYANIAFCTATISNLPLYIIKNGDTGGNVPGGANTLSAGNWTRIPIDIFIGANKFFDFDGNYLITPNPGYYYVTMEFTLQCTDSGNPIHEMTLSMMNQSDGANNLYFNFTVTNTPQQYSYTGILPLRFNNQDGDLHFAFTSSEVFTFKVSSISTNVSFYV